MVEIRQADNRDFDKIWPIFQEIVIRGDTYAFSPDTSKPEAYQLWMELPTATYVAVHKGEIVVTYYVKPNQPGLGSHVCNAGFMVDSQAQGQGIGRALGEHSLVEARKLGFKAMQFNFVTSTNKRAVKLWLDLGFSIIGTLPKAFQHRKLGFVDVFVMYKLLESAT